jgi:hypothetical protein
MSPLIPTYMTHDQSLSKAIALESQTIFNYLVDHLILPTSPWKDELISNTKLYVICSLINN